MTMMCANGALTGIPILVHINHFVRTRCSTVLVNFSCISNCYYMLRFALMLCTVPIFSKGMLSEVRAMPVRLVRIVVDDGINISLQGVCFSTCSCIIVFAVTFCPVARFHKGVIFEMRAILAMVLLNEEGMIISVQRTFCLVTCLLTTFPLLTLVNCINCTIMGWKWYRAGIKYIFGILFFLGATFISRMPVFTY